SNITPRKHSVNRLRCQRENGSRSSRATSSADFAAPLVIVPSPAAAFVSPACGRVNNEAARTDKRPAEQSTGLATGPCRRTGSRPSPGPIMLDVFTHFMPKPFLDRLGELIPGHPVLAAFPRIKTLWDVDARLALLDEFPGLQQVLSLANPPIELIAPPDRTP